MQEYQIEEKVPVKVGSQHKTDADRSLAIPARATSDRVVVRPSTSSLKGLLRRSGALDLVSVLTARDRAEILLYHGFCPGNEPDPMFPRLMPISLFEEHVRTCARYLRPLSLEQLLDPGACGVAITFDDGFANNFELAFPILQKYGFPATIFLTTGFLDLSTPLWGNWLDYVVMNAAAQYTILEWNGHPIELSISDATTRRGLLSALTKDLRLLPIEEIHDRLRRLERCLQVKFDWQNVPRQHRPLSWEQARAMRQTGIISFGAHTVSHPVLSRCTPATQSYEISQSKRRIEEELGEECTVFAYPYGKGTDYNATTRDIVEGVGFRLALTAEHGSMKPSRCNPFEIPRWGADLAVNELSFLVSGGPMLSSYFRGDVQR